MTNQVTTVRFSFWFRGTITLALAFFFAATVNAGKIQQTQQTTRSSAASDRDDSDDDDDDDDDGGGLRLVGAILGAIFGGDDDSESSSRVASGQPSSYVIRETAYHRYPYESNRRGIAVVTTRRYSPYHQLRSTHVSPSGADPHGGKRFSGNWQADYNYDWDQVHISTIRARLVSSSVVGVDLKWSGLFEPLDEGGVDTAHMAETSLTFNRAFTPDFMARFGIGGHLMAFPDGHPADVVFGATGLVGFDLFPAKPLTLSLEFQMGYLNEAIYIRGEGTLGVMLVGPLEAYVGYRGQSFRNVHTDNSVKYHGFTAGLRLWF